jgi:predicted metal-dependent hydrolase
MSLTNAAPSAEARPAPRELAAARVIAPRPARFGVPAGTPRYWFDGNAYMTHVMNALSLTFPEGERYFIASVRAVSAKVTEPALQRQVRGFSAQEGMHRREHASFNEWLRAQGLDVDRYYDEVARLLRVDEPRERELFRLAVTCALEHFTAILGEQWLTRDDIRGSAHPNVRPLWTWHALEELDHKSVAFDVYQAVGGPYSLRVSVMLGVSVTFLWKVGSIHARLMRADRQLDPRAWLAGIWRCWRPRGYFSTLLPAYLRYFKRGFHPWERDDSALVSHFERELDALASAEPPGSPLADST